MVLNRFLLALLLALVTQAVAFAFYYSDLLALRQPPERLAVAPLALSVTAESALARPTLTRQHLETIVEAAQHAGRPDLEVRALARLVDMQPDDPALALRYGDALRRAGRFEEAEHVFRRVLASTVPSGVAP